MKPPPLRFLAASVGMLSPIFVPMWFMILKEIYHAA